MLSGNYYRKVTTMKNSALNWIDDEGYCGYPTARVKGGVKQTVLNRCIVEF